MKCHIRTISEDPYLLEAVIDLADRNKQTLGFLPEAVFWQAAQVDHILVAVGEQDDLLGYLLFRIVNSKHSAAITHLCVEIEHRRKGIARQLVEHLINHTDHLRGINLYSRRDYESNSLWPKLGFECIGEKRGRGRDREWLSHYWYDHGQPSLLMLMEDVAADEKELRAVIDHNIFVYLFEDSEYPLAADWLLSDVGIYLTPEHNNEINRDESDTRRQAMWRYAESFHRTRGERERLEWLRQYLRPYFPIEMTERDHSDLRHLTHAIEFEADFFVTNDRDLQRDLEEIVRREFNVRIVTDTELIVHLDELMQEAKYQPRRWAGTYIHRSHVSAGESDTLAEIFHRYSGERKAEFRERLDYYLARPQEFETYVLSSAESDPLAIVVFTVGERYLRDVPLLRSAEGALSPALESSIVSWLIAQDALAESRLVQVSDERLSSQMLTGLQENSFIKTSDGWLKLNLPGIHTVSDVADAIDKFDTETTADRSLFLTLRDELNRAQANIHTEGLISLEKRLWPLKLVEAEISSYIVPIQPQWAAELFDAGLSRQTLFGADPSLMLKMDNVYYRSARPALPTAPSRILWYVSRGRNHSYTGVMAARACSYVEETVIGLPKDVFRQFSALGVYRWQQVFEAANESVHDNVLAFRFGKSELFETPVPLRKICEITGWNSAPFAPWSLTNEAFLEIYSQGTGLKKET